MADATDSKSVGGNPMRVRLSPRASVMLTSLFLALTQLAVAQKPALRGTILAAESGDPLGFSIVSLHPGRGQQFTDAAGTFTFEIAKAGNYLLSVRQIGYAPFDTQLVIGDRATSVHITLRIPVLPIRATRHCAPSSTNSRKTLDATSCLQTPTRSVTRWSSPTEN